MAVVRLKLIYPEALIREPILARAVKEVGIEPSIRKAEVEGDVGVLVCELEAEPSLIDEALKWFKDRGLEVEILGSEV